MVKYFPGVLTKRISADDLRARLNQEVGRYITQLSPKKISAITASFGQAALRARETGLDTVQIHGDRMCGSFSSSLFNRRTDIYGGTAEKRARFAADAVKAVREAPPSIPILEQAGITSFHVTLADHGQLSDTIPPANHPAFSGEGCFLPFCDTVRKLTKLPICGVGGLTSPSYIKHSYLPAESTVPR